MRTKERILIRSLSIATSEVALQVSRNLFQYFSADSEIVGEGGDLNAEGGNVISIAVGTELPSSSVHDWFPVFLAPARGICIRKPSGLATVRLREGLGATFLRPLTDGRLELVVWGLDDQGLRQAARLLPTLTGVGQPELVVVSKRCAWEGAGGVLAMGTFDCCWKVSEDSFVA